MKSNIPRATLTNNYTISRVIKGGWQLAGGHGVIHRGKAIEDMFEFVKAGITTFDCADIYTGVEEMIGEFLLRYKKRYGKNMTSKIHIHTKFVPDLDLIPTMTKKDAQKIIDRSLKRLGVDQLDLIQYHWWDYDIPRYVEVAGYLADMQKMGKIRFIGVTNFDVSRLKEIVQSGVRIVSNQVQYSVIDRRPEHKMIKFCEKNNIKLLCYGTAAGGFISEKYLGVKEPEGQLENRSLTKYKLIIEEFGGWDLFQNLLGVLRKIADKHGVSIPSIATRFILGKPQVAGIIIGARDTSHLKDNVRIFDFKLDLNDLKFLNEMLKASNGSKGDTYDLERIKGGIHAGIMKYNLNKV